METNKLALKTVKVISQQIKTDWIHPYRNKQTGKGIGSGFFIDLEGHILTCAHVVDDAVKIFVEIPNHGDEKIEVEVLGLCPNMDIALLKTKNYKNKDFYKLHEENYIYDIHPGSDALAIGFPLGQDNIKYTKGIISGRQNGKIQTDTPINPGNSGGPLLLDDKVIGINSSGFIFANNIGYAIPISYFYLLKDLLFDKKTKLIRRPFLGLSYQNSNKPLLDVNNCKCETGVFVKTIFKGSPIEKCGIRKNDIICKFGGLKIDNFGLLDKEWFNEKMKIDDILRRVPNNGKVDIEFWRDKKLYKKSFKYSPFSLEINTKYPIYEPIDNNYEVFGGMIVMEMTVNHLKTIVSKLLGSISQVKDVTSKINNILTYLDSEKRTEAKLIVTHVFPNSYLHNLEILEEYDTIERVNGELCNTIEDYRKNIFKFRKTKKGNFIEIITELNKRIVLEVDKMFSEEKIFSKTYKYPISKTILKLTEFKKNKKKTNKKKTNKKKN